MKPNPTSESSATAAPLKWLRRALVAVIASTLPLAALGQANYSTPYTFITVAGLAGSGGTNDGVGSAARLEHPEGLALDAAGNIYVADYYGHTIRKMSPAGLVTTIAGEPWIAGSSDGTGRAAHFNNPQGVVVDTNGNVYVGDSGNHTIRKITPAGVVTTLAGAAGVSGNADGSGSAARFSYPQGVALDSTGVLYVADTVNNRIRRVSPAGEVTTLAVGFTFPYAVAIDNADNMYVADSNADAIRKVSTAGVVTLLAGRANFPGSTDGVGAAARFNLPDGLAVDGMGNVYVADTYNHTIRKVTAAGEVTTLAGLAMSSGDSDGTGSAARFDTPFGVAVDNAGALYVADTGNNTIRKGTFLPTVQVAATPTNGMAPLTVQFTCGDTDSAGNTITNWNWTFGDGGSSNARNPMHVYRMGGRFAPALAATNSAGVAVASSIPAITVSAPTVGYAANPNAGGVPLVVQFTSPGTDSSGQPVTHWNWTFGDGATSTLQNPQHTYATAGTFAPTLTVTNGNDVAIAASGPVIHALARSGLVLNGGFENGDFAGWILNGDAGLYNLVDTFNQSSEGMQPHGGSYFARLGQTGRLGYLSQTLSTTVGARYLLSFWLNSPDGFTPNQFSVSWSGTVLYSRSNLVASGWTNLQFVVTATAASTILQFGFRDDPTALGLDDINVVPLAPAINAQPQTQIVSCHSNATFSVAAMGATTLSYQWQRNGVALNGETNAGCSVTPLTCGGPDNYSVIVTNSGGAITSAVATLTVIDISPPVLRCPSNMVVNTAPGEYAAQVWFDALATDNCAVASLVVTPPSGSVFPKGTTAVHCTATDCGGNTSSNSFLVTVVLPNESTPGVFAPGTTNYGRTYGEWSAAHWQWLYSLPVDHHPLFETADASAGQTGMVWFLGGTYVTSTTSNGTIKGTATRQCNIPEGTALFIPIIDAESATAEGNGTNYAQLLANSQFLIDHATNLSFSLDGRPIPALQDYRTSSPLFTWGPLPANNVFGDPAHFPSGQTSPSVSDGYYVMLIPPALGNHTIHFTGGVALSAEEGGPFDFELDITYNLTVLPAVINLTCADSTVVVTWPQTLTSYTLESTESLNPARWTPLQASVRNTPANRQVTIPANGSSQFFRLRHQ